MRFCLLLIEYLTLPSIIGFFCISSGFLQNIFIMFYPFFRHSKADFVSFSSLGRGVFAAARIPAYTVLETCPVLVLDPTENKDHIAKTELFHYT
jgi:hypothetical protein